MTGRDVDALVRKVTMTNQFFTLPLWCSRPGHGRASGSPHSCIILCLKCHKQITLKKDAFLNNRGTNQWATPHVAIFLSRSSPKMTSIKKQICELLQHFTVDTDRNHPPQSLPITVIFIRVVTHVHRSGSRFRWSYLRGRRYTILCQTCVHRIGKHAETWLTFCFPQVTLSSLKRSRRQTFPVCCIEGTMLFCSKTSSGKNKETNK